MKPYWVIRPDFAGSVHVYNMDKDEVQELIRELKDTDGEAKFIFDLQDADPSFWPEGAILIVKGDLVTPKPREVVQEWDL